MPGRSTRHRRSTALRNTARITALSVSAAMMVGGAALTAAAVSVTDPANCTAEASCNYVEVYIDESSGLLTAEDVPAIRAGTTVELINASGQSVASVQLKADSGFFERFENVPAGTYTVKATLPEGYKIGAMDRNGYSWAAGSATSDPFDIGQWGAQLPLNILPDVATGTVSLDLFSDMDRDGVLDAGEDGLTGFSAGLFPVGGGTQIAGFKTGELSGGTAVVTVQPGTYQLLVSRPAGWSHVTGTLGTSNATEVTVTADQTTKVSAGMKDEADCVTTPTRCGTLQAYAFTTDANDTRTPEPDVQLALLDVTGATVAYATTGLTGVAPFTVAPGYYSLEVVYSADTDIAAGGDFDTTTSRTPQRLVEKQRTDTANLALQAGDGIGDGPVDERQQGSLNVRGWIDLNGDGEFSWQDDDTTEAWASIATDGADPIVVKSTSGVSLPQDDYTFDLSQQPAGWKAVTANGTFTLGNEYTLEVQLEPTDVAPEGKSLIRVDAWYDVDGDGTKDAAEVPAPDLYFELEGVAGNNVDWADSDDNGLAVFDTAEPGEYVVKADIDPKYDPAGLAIVSGDLDKETLASARFTVAADETKTLKVGYVDDEHPLVATPPTDNPTTPPTDNPTTPPTGDPVTDDPETDEPVKVVQGEAITVRGEGFTGGETVEVWVHSDPVKLAETLATDSGAVVAQVTIPKDLAPGAHRIELRGLTSGVSTWTDIVVVSANTPGPGGNLADTGAGSLGLMLLGVGLMLGVGGLMVRKPEGTPAAA